MKVFVVTQGSGEYEDYWREIIGIFSTEEKALECASYVDGKSIVHDEDFPMTQEVYCDNNYGYPDDCDYGEGERIDRGGYTAEDYEKYDELEAIAEQNYSECRIEEYELDAFFGTQAMMKG